MSDRNLTADGPLVSVVTCTFNRRAYLPEAIGFAVRQTYRNLQIIVVNDGGAHVGDIVGSFHDDRIVYLNNAENHGKAACLNQALSRAQGKYVAYLDDDDIHYPWHVESLVAAMEGPTDCQVAYGDLYRTMFRLGPGGKRIALGKYLEIIRDFDRFFLFNFNHVLHVSLMHRRDLLDKTGPYNERVKVLIDWDMTRRLAFFSDFVHVARPTGEYGIPMESRDQSDRISSRMRRDPAEYERNIRTIRTTRPPKPWPKVQDLSIVLLAPRMDLQTADMLGRIWKHTFVPYQVYLPLPAGDLASLDMTQMPNLVGVSVSEDSPPPARLDQCLRRCEGDCIAVVPPGTAIGDLWVEKAMHALVHSSQPNAGYRLDGPLPGAVLRKDELARARGANPALGIKASLDEAGVTLRRAEMKEMPFVFDEVLRTVNDLEAEGDWKRASEFYDHLPACYANELWMMEKNAWALHRSGNDERAMELCRRMNDQRPTVESLLLEAKLCRRAGRLEQAVAILERAQSELQWKG